jgi:hypothetical protein
MIRCAGDKRLFQRGGERRKIGRLARASLDARNQVERYDPEGLRNPGGERRSDKRQQVPERNLTTGYVH